ncbi:hypothetical protein [Nonomuraea sp. NPDC049709]|uniref:hypothetical protein n=1 Tax=Nonomuraea sp. NPDC049709 TaxID=3154736 RepID=UPI003441D39F
MIGEVPVRLERSAGSGSGPGGVPVPASLWAGDVCAVRSAIRVQADPSVETETW